MNFPAAYWGVNSLPFLFTVNTLPVWQLAIHLTEVY